MGYWLIILITIGTVVDWDFSFSENDFTVLHHCGFIPKIQYRLLNYLGDISLYHRMYTLTWISDK